MTSAPATMHITALRVENFRALRSVRFQDLTPLTVLLGPNGSGKSTVFDVFAFLSECFESGLRRAWDRRGRARELRTRGSNGPVVVEVKYREKGGDPLITYRLELDEDSGRPVVAHESLRWRRGSHGRPFRFLEYHRGRGEAATGEQPDATDTRDPMPLKSPDVLAVSTLGQLADHPRVVALRDFITAWHVSYLSVDSTRRLPEAGPQERLSRTGDNLANLIQHLSEQHTEELSRIFRKLRQRVPRVESVLSEPLPDGRLLLQIKDTPFENPALARFTSDGTLKLLAYLVLLHDPQMPPFIGIEEPENYLYPRLLQGLAEECRSAGSRTQLLVATHSPYFVNALRPSDVRFLWRDRKGYTQTRRASDMKGVKAFVENGALLGDLWMEGYLQFEEPSIASMYVSPGS